MTPMLTIDEALLALRTEANAGNIQLVQDLLQAIPPYITTTTGILLPEIAVEVCPLLKTLAKFLLCLWYNPDGTDAVQLQVVVNNLLKTLKAMAAQLNAETTGEGS